MSTRAVIRVGVIALVVGSCSAGEPTVPSTSASTAMAQDSATTIAALPTTTAGPSSTSATATTTSTTSPPSSWVEDVAVLFEELGVADGFAGAALIGLGDEAIWWYASGLADMVENRPNEVDTKFNIGSMSKMFTAVAVLQLMEQGKLSLDDSIVELLPGYPNTAVAGAVTIHHLLTHTSGLGDTFTAKFAENPNKYRSNADFLPLFVDDPLLFDPGESFSYSNAGYVVLGLIIEEVSGRDYYDYVRDNIFTPAGMVDTDSYALDEDVANLAMGYTTRDIDGGETGVLAANAPLMPGRGFAAGGGYSTVADLFRFRNRLLGHRLLTAESTDLLFEEQVELGPGFEYGYGFMIRDGDGSVGHTGGAPGICSFFSMYPASGYSLIVLSNSDDDCLALLDYVRSNPPG